MELFGYPVQSIYLFGLIAGGIMTLLYILFSDLLEGMFEFIPDGILNPTLVLSFLTFFSATGYLMEKLTAVSHLLIAAVSFLLALGLTTLLNVFVLVPLNSAEESLAYSEDDLRGRTGKVIVSIPKDGYGEVILEGTGGTISKSAMSFDEEEIPSGNKVLVIDVKNGVLYVSPIESLEEY